MYYSSETSTLVASLVNQTTPTAAFIHFGINTRREGLANCLYHIESTRTYVDEIIEHVLLRL